MSELTLIIGLVVALAFASSCTVQISGTATGANCGSYPNCLAVCCTNTYGSCSGTNTYNCAQWVNKPQCDAHPQCCFWYDTAAVCNRRLCIAMTEADCIACGCTRAGSCAPKACSAIADNNPDVCAGCSTCGGDWDINNDRGLTPWAITVTGELHLAAGGHLVASSYQLRVGSIRTVAGSGLLHVRTTTSGSIKVT